MRKGRACEASRARWIRVMYLRWVYFLGRCRPPTHAGTPTHAARTAVARRRTGRPHCGGHAPHCGARRGALRSAPDRTAVRPEPHCAPPRPQCGPPELQCGPPRTAVRSRATAVRWLARRTAVTRDRSAVTRDRTAVEASPHCAAEAPHCARGLTALRHAHTPGPAQCGAKLPAVCRRRRTDLAFARPSRERHAGGATRSTISRCRNVLLKLAHHVGRARAALEPRPPSMPASEVTSIEHLCGWPLLQVDHEALEAALGGGFVG